MMSRYWSAALIGLPFLLSCAFARPPGPATPVKPGAPAQARPGGARRSGEAPAGERTARIDRAGVTVIPSGRLLTPRGRQITVAPHPFGLALSPDGKTMVTANSGTGPFSITVIRNPWTADPSVRQVPPDAGADENPLKSVFMGLAFARDNRTLYVSGGNDGTIHVFDTVTGQRTAGIPCNDAAHPESYLGDLALSPDGRTLYAVDQAHFRLIVVDTEANKVVASARVGRYPFAVAASPDGRRVYVANVGMYEYRPIEGGRLDYPPFGVPSKEAEEGTVIDGKRVPGLGSPNAPESFSVWTLDVTDRDAPKVTARLKTGVLVGQSTDLEFPAVGGSSPNSLAVTNNRIYVTNGNNDTVQVIEAATNRIAATIPLGPLPGLKQRGALPFGLALSPDGRRLYVAEAGINAVAVIDTQAKKLLGHIPAGWYPSKVRVSPDGRTLYVSNAKGFGSGPSGGPRHTGPGWVGALMKGTVSVMAVPKDAELPGLTRRVLANNGFPPAKPDARLAALRKRIRHVVFITKENRCLLYTSRCV